MAVGTSTPANANDVQRAYETAGDWTRYDGERVKGSNSAPVYLILHGQLRWIPDPTTYNNLFKDWNGIGVNDYLVDNVPVGLPLTSGAVLAKGSGAAIYVITNGQKLWIPDPTVFNKFYFNSGKVVTVPDVIINSVPQGLNIG
jgi:hypothetical protein